MGRNGPRSSPSKCNPGLVPAKLWPSRDALTRYGRLLKNEQEVRFAPTGMPPAATATDTQGPPGQHVTGGD